MAVKTRLNLKGIISPLDLLKCKSLLNTMAAGELLEVILADPDVADQLTTIVERSEDELFYRKKDKEEICICIRKGNRHH